MKPTQNQGRTTFSPLSWEARALGEVLHEREPETEALVTPQARFTYGALLENAKVAAGSMQALGLKRGDRVGILMGNDEKWLALFYGAALIGAIAVPLDTRFKQDEIDFCLKMAGCRALFYVERFLDIDFGAMVRRLGIRHAYDVSRGIPLAEFSGAAVAPDDVLLIQFTSGTSAHRKGVTLTHDNVLRNAWAAGTRVGMRADDRTFNCLPFSHLSGSTLSALMALVRGACLVTSPSFDAGAALVMMERERCTLVSGDDSAFRMLVGHADLAKRKLCLRGGWAAAGPQTMRAIIDVLGAKHICSAYGLSEASPSVAMSDWRDPEPLRVEGLAKPHEGVDVRIRDNEIQVRGWNVMKGYCSDPDGNAKAFTADGWLRTGDRGELAADGRLRMVGRLKELKP